MRSHPQGAAASAEAPTTDCSFRQRRRSPHQPILSLDLPDSTPPFATREVLTAKSDVISPLIKLGSR